MVTGWKLRRYLSLGDVHEHGEAGHMVALAADVAAVPVEHLATFGGPATRAADPEHDHKKKMK